MSCGVEWWDEGAGSATEGIGKREKGREGDGSVTERRGQDSERG